MKVNKMIKAVAAVTTLGVFLAGCSGGNSTPTRSNTVPTPTTNTSTLPPASGTTPTVGGGGTVTVGGNAIEDDIRAAQIAQDAKLDQILKASKGAEDAANSAKDKANWAMWLGVGTVAAIAAGALFNAIRENNSEDGHFFSGLVGSNYGQRTDVARKEANKAVEAAKVNTDNSLKPVNTKLDQANSGINTVRTEANANAKAMGKEVANLKNLAALNALVGITGIKATAAVGAKVEQALKGQDELAAKLRVVQANTDSIKTSALKIEASQDRSETAQNAAKAALETMKGQLEAAKTAQDEASQKLAKIIADSKDAEIVAQLTQYNDALSAKISEAEQQLKESIEAVSKQFPTANEIVRALPAAQPPQPQILVVPVGGGDAVLRRTNDATSAAEPKRESVQMGPQATAK